MWVYQLRCYAPAALHGLAKTPRLASVRGLVGTRRPSVPSGASTLDDRNDPSVGLRQRAGSGPENRRVSTREKLNPITRVAPQGQLPPFFQGVDMI